MSCEGSPKQKSVIQKKDEKITKVSGEKHTLNTIDNKLDIIIKTQNQYTKSMKNDIKEMKGIISTKNITNNPWPYVICFVAFLTFLFIDPAYSRFGLKRRKE
jgi:hypothetical protein